MSKGKGYCLRQMGEKQKTPHALKLNRKFQVLTNIYIMKVMAANQGLSKFNAV